MCAESADGKMADGCGCDPLDDTSCVSGNCARDNPMLLDVGTCQPGATPAFLPVCYNNGDCESGSCSLVRL